MSVYSLLVIILDCESKQNEIAERITMEGGVSYPAGPILYPDIRWIQEDLTSPSLKHFP